MSRSDYLTERRRILDQYSSHTITHEEMMRQLSRAYCEFWRVKEERAAS